MVAGDGEEELVVEEVLDGDFFVGGRALDEAEIGFRGEDPGGDLVGIAAFDGELNAGVGAEECAEDAREQVLGDGGGGGDAEWSAGLSLEVGEGGQCFLGESCGTAGVVEDEGSGRGEGDAGRSSIEEAEAECFFEEVDVLADGRLADAQQFSSAAEAGLLGDGAEDLQTVILEHPHLRKERGDSSLRL